MGAMGTLARKQTERTPDQLGPFVRRDLCGERTRAGLAADQTEGSNAPLANSDPSLPRQCIGERHFEAYGSIGRHPCVAAA